MEPPPSPREEGELTPSPPNQPPNQLPNQPPNPQPNPPPNRVFELSSDSDDNEVGNEAFEGSVQKKEAVESDSDENEAANETDGGVQKKEAGESDSESTDLFEATSDEESILGDRPAEEVEVREESGPEEEMDLADVRKMFEGAPGPGNFGKRGVWRFCDRCLQNGKKGGNTERHFPCPDCGKGTQVNRACKNHRKGPPLCLEWPLVRLRERRLENAAKWNGGVEARWQTLGLEAEEEDGKKKKKGKKKADGKGKKKAEKDGKKPPKKAEEEKKAKKTAEDGKKKGKKEKEAVGKKEKEAVGKKEKGVVGKKEKEEVGKKPVKRRVSENDVFFDRVLRSMRRREEEKEEAEAIAEVHRHVYGECSGTSRPPPPTRSVAQPPPTRPSVAQNLNDWLAGAPPLGRIGFGRAPRRISSSPEIDVKTPPPLPPSRSFFPGTPPPKRKKEKSGDGFVLPDISDGEAGDGQNEEVKKKDGNEVAVLVKKLKVPPLVLRRSVVEKEAEKKRKDEAAKKEAEKKQREVERKQKEKEAERKRKEWVKRQIEAMSLESRKREDERSRLLAQSDAVAERMMSSWMANLQKEEAAAKARRDEERAKEKEWKARQEEERKRELEEMMQKAKELEKMAKDEEAEGLGLLEAIAGRIQEEKREEKEATRQEGDGNETMDGGLVIDETEAVDENEGDVTHNVTLSFQTAGLGFLHEPRGGNAGQSGGSGFAFNYLSPGDGKENELDGVGPSSSLDKEKKKEESPKKRGGEEKK